MRRWSLRRRLAFAAAGFGTAVALLAIAIVFVGEVVVVRTVTLDLLRKDLAQLRSGDVAEDNPGPRVRSDAYAIFEGGRRLRGTSSWDWLGLSFADLQDIDEGAETSLSIRRDGRSIRVLASHDPATGRIDAVARDETKTDRAITMLGWVIVSVSPLLVLMSCVGGAAIANALVRPVTRLERQIERIGAARLSTRVRLDRGPQEFVSLAGEFNSLLDRLEDAFEVQRRFAADASHELRTPLAAMRAVGESAVLGDGDDDALRDAVGSMLEEADRLSRIVEQLLSIARLSPDAVQSASVDLIDVARRVLERLQPLAEDAGIVMTAEGGGVTARADAMLVDRIISSLVDNAIRHGAGRRVRVCVRQDGAEAVLLVADEGRGMPPEDLARIWAPFARGRGAERGTGSGLGLALTQSACRVMGGSISVESTLGEGTTFEVRLPASG